MSAEPKWRRFERLVAHVQKELAPNAVVTHNDQILGRDSGEFRQIDITVKQKIGQYDILIAIDCKDFKEAVNVDEVEKFIGLIKDIKAHKGVMVAAHGFSKTAKIVGEKAGLNLYRLVDTEAHDWQTYVSIPVLCDFRGIQQYQFSIPSPIVSFLVSTDPNKIVVYHRAYKRPLTLVSLLQDYWNSRKLPCEPGEHRDIPLTRVLVAILEGGKTIEADILAHIVVERRLFFGELPLAKVRGFKDEYTGKVLTRQFTTGGLNFDEVERTWRRLEAERELAIEPFLKFQALDYYTIAEE